LAAGVAGGCGDRSDPRPTRLHLTAPADSAVVHEDSVVVRGRVAPEGATVLVGGRPTTVSGSQFSARVPLREGGNVIDVGASAPGRLPVWRAVRVSRRIVVRVPELSGESRDDAVAALRALGLVPKVREGHGLLDALLPGGWGVCETRPGAGTEVPKGAHVELRVSKTC
jgi:hypothetical protein